MSSQPVSCIRRCLLVPFIPPVRILAASYCTCSRRSLSLSVNLSLKTSAYSITGRTKDLNNLVKVILSTWTCLPSLKLSHIWAYQERLRQRTTPRWVCCFIIGIKQVRERWFQSFDCEGHTFGLSGVDGNEPSIFAHFSILLPQLVSFESSSVNRHTMFVLPARSCDCRYFVIFLQYTCSGKPNTPGTTAWSLSVVWQNR